MGEETVGQKRKLRAGGLQAAPEPPLPALATADGAGAAAGAAGAGAAAPAAAAADRGGGSDGDSEEEEEEEEEEEDEEVTGSTAALIAAAELARRQAAMGSKVKSKLDAFLSQPAVADADDDGAPSPGPAGAAAAAGAAGGAAEAAGEPSLLDALDGGGGGEAAAARDGRSSKGSKGGAGDGRSDARSDARTDGGGDADDRATTTDAATLPRHAAFEDSTEDRTADGGRTQTAEESPALDGGPFRDDTDAPSQLTDAESMRQRGGESVAGDAAAEPPPPDAGAPDIAAAAPAAAAGAAGAAVNNKVKEEVVVKMEPGMKQEPAETQHVKKEAKVKVKKEPQEEKPQSRWGYGGGEGTFPKRPQVKECFEKVAQSVWDVDSWVCIMKELRGLPLKQVEDVYKRFLHYYPTAGWVHCDYLTAIQEHSRREETAPETRRELQRVQDQLFGAALIRMQEPRIWRMYVAHVMEKNAGGSSQETKKAVQFACDKLSTDWECDILYKIYIQFLEKAGQGYIVTEEMRDVYKKWLKTPTRDLDDTLIEYERFERKLNQAKPMRLSEETRSHVDRAKHHYLDLSRHTSRLDTDQFSRPLHHALKSVTAQRPIPREFEQVALWYRLIEFEKEDRMLLGGDALHKRILGILNKALVCTWRYFGHHHDLAMEYLDKGNILKVNQTFIKGMQACPDNLCLRLVYADWLATLSPDHKLKMACRPRVSAFDPIQLVWQRDGQTVPQHCEGPTPVHNVDQSAKEYIMRPFGVGQLVFEDAILLTDGDRDRRTVVWAHYLRFVKPRARSEVELRQEQNIEARAHEDPLTQGGEVYSAFARLEMADHTAQSAKRRQYLHKGYTRLRDEKALTPAFVLRYIEVLAECGDSNSLRTLFEQLFGERRRDEEHWATGHPPSAVLECHNRHVEFQCWHGDLTKVRKAEADRRRALGVRKVGFEATQLVHRYAVDGLLPVTQEELAVLHGIERAYFRLLGEEERDAGPANPLRRRDMQRRPLTEQGLSAHTNPHRPQSHQIRPIDLTNDKHWSNSRQFDFMPRNTMKWTDRDDQNSDLTKPVVPVGGQWNVHKAPKLKDEEDGRVHVPARPGEHQGSSQALPSHVRRMVACLPSGNSYTGKRPSTKYLIDLFLNNRIPTLAKGKIDEATLANARRTLKRWRFAAEQLIEDDCQAKVKKQIEDFKRDKTNLQQCRYGNDLQLAFDQVMTHLKPELDRKRERERELAEREQQQGKGAKNPRLR